MSNVLKPDRPLSRSTLADSVYETVLAAILTGKLANGTELSEVALAGELGVSRTPVHEAVRRLTADGLVEHARNRQPRVVSLTTADIHEIYEMRRLLEPAAAELAAARLGDDRLADLRAQSDALAAAPARSWPARAIEFDIRFHDALAAASGNSRLEAEITKYRRLVRAFCRATGSLDNLRAAFDEHQRILDALAARDARAAGVAMRTHIEARLDAVRRQFDDPAGHSS